MKQTTNFSNSKWIKVVLSVLTLLAVCLVVCAILIKTGTIHSSTPKEEVVEPIEYIADNSNMQFNNSIEKLSEADYSIRDNQIVFADNVPTTGSICVSSNPNGPSPDDKWVEINEGNTFNIQDIQKEDNENSEIAKKYVYWKAGTSGNYKVEYGSTTSYFDSLVDAYTTIVNAGNQGTITVLNDVTDTSEFIIQDTKNITLDLNNNTINKTSGNITIDAGGTLIIEGDGTINASVAEMFNNNGTLNINGGTIISNSNKVINMSSEPSSVTNINGGSITGKSDTICLQKTNCQLNVIKGTIEATGGNAIYNFAGIVTIGIKDKIANRNDIVIIGTTYGCSNGDKLNVYDGIFKGKTEGIRGKVNDVEIGYDIYTEDTETISSKLYHLAYLKEAPYYEIEGDSQLYSSISQVMEALPSEGGKVKLLQTHTEPYKVDITKNIELNMDGKEVTYTNISNGKIENDVICTIKGGGKITIGVTTSAISVLGTLNLYDTTLYSENCTSTVSVGGILNMYSGTIKNKYTSQNTTAAYVIKVAGEGIANIIGGTIEMDKSSKTSGTYAFLTGIDSTVIIGSKGGDVSSNNPTIIGGSFGFDWGNMHVNTDAPLYNNAGIKFYDGIIKYKNTFYNGSHAESEIIVEDGYSIKHGTSGVYKTAYLNLQHRVSLTETKSGSTTTKYYNTLQSAVNAASNASTLASGTFSEIKMLESEELSKAVTMDSTKKIRLDLYGKTVSIDDNATSFDNGIDDNRAAVIAVNGATLEIIDSSSEKTGTLLANSTKDNIPLLIGVSDSSNVKLISGNLQAEGGFAFAVGVKVRNGHFEMAGGNINLTSSNVALYGIEIGTEATAVFSGGEINLNSTSNNVVVGIENFNNKENITSFKMTGGTINANGSSGVTMGITSPNKTITEITGGEINASNDSSSSTCYGVLAYYGDVKVSGGVFRSYNKQFIASGIQVEKDGRLFITDCNVESKSDAQTAYGIYVNNTQANITGGSIKGITSKNAYGLYAITSSKIDLNGGSIDAESTASNIARGIYLDADCELDMKNGNIVSTSANGSANGIEFYNDTADSIISGGTVTTNAPHGNNYAVYALGSGGNITITDGTFEAGAGGNSYGVYIVSSGHALTIGEEGGEVSITKPSIKGATRAVNASNGFSFYDGILISDNSTVHTGTATVEGGYEIVKENKNSVYQETLKQIIETIEITPETYTYTGNPITPDTVVVKVGDTVLTENTDYELSYSNNTAVGEATVTATGKGNYTGTISGTYTIERREVSLSPTETDVTVIYGKTLQVAFTYNGDGTVSATSDDTSKVTVTSVDMTNQKVTIKGVALGTAHISLSASEGATTDAISAAQQINVTVVDEAPVIKTQPVSAERKEKESAVSFKVVMDKGTNLRYQWYKDGTPLTGKTSATYTIAKANVLKELDGSTYYCEISNSAGHVTTNTLSLTVFYAPKINIQPLPQTVLVGENATFTISATDGNPTPTTYKWQVSSNDGTTWVDAEGMGTGYNTDTFVLSPVTVGINGYLFRCLLGNEKYNYTVVSDEVSITVNNIAPVLVSSKPANVAVKERARDVSFAVQTTEGTNLTYQWYVNTVNNNTTGTLIENENGETFTIQQSDVTREKTNTYYYCVVSNNAGSVTSRAAKLTVYYPPTIKTQPTNKTVTVGETAQFKVVVNAGSPTTTFTWQVSKDNGTTWNNITSTDGTATKTSTTGTFTTVASTLDMNNNLYRCIIGNSQYTAQDEIITSNEVKLTVNKKTPTLTPLDTVVSIPKETTVEIEYEYDGDGTVSAISSNTSYVIVETVDEVNKTITLRGVEVGNAEISLSASEGTEYYSVSASQTIAAQVVDQDIVISTQPKAVSKKEQTGAVSFKVVASGTSLSYQWYVASSASATGSEISGATSATYTIPKAEVTRDKNGTYYYCKVSNNSNPEGVRTSSAKLTVYYPPAYTDLIENQEAIYRETASFSVSGIVSNGNPTATTYKWQVNSGEGWVDANDDYGTGYDTANFTTTATTFEMNGYKYRCLIGNSQYKTDAELVASNEATLAVIDIAPTITSQPVNKSLKEKSAAVSFSITANGTNLEYQWYKNSTDSNSGGTIIDGATNATYTIPKNSVLRSLNDMPYYYCVVRNGANVSGLSSNTAKIQVYYPPTITDGPEDTETRVGQTGTFTVVATSGKPDGITYKWQVSTNNGVTWSNITASQENNANTETLTIVNASLEMNNNLYRCLLGNSQYTTTSQLVVSEAARLTVRDVSPTLSVSKPEDVSLKENESNAVFTVEASGTNLQYQWYKKANSSVTTGEAIDGEVTNTYTIPSAQVIKELNGSYYYCVVSNNEGSVTSREALLKVYYPPVIETQPADKSVNVNVKASFKVDVTQGNPSTTTYKWQISTNGGETWSDAGSAHGSGYNTETFTTIKATIDMNQNKYRCIIGNAQYPEVISDVAILTVTDVAPVITTQPKNVNRKEQVSNAAFSVAATGMNLKYQWFKNTTNSNQGGVEISGETGKKYIITAENVVRELNKTYYYCVVSNSAGTVTSNAARLQVYYPPTINTEPTDKSVYVGEEAAFKIVVNAGNPGTTYRWQVSTDNGISWRDAGGDDGTSYNKATFKTIATTMVMNGNLYRCYIGNSQYNNAELSETARLEVKKKTPTLEVNPEEKMTIVKGNTKTGTYTFTGDGNVVISATNENIVIQKEGKTFNVLGAKVGKSKIVVTLQETDSYYGLTKEIEVDVLEANYSITKNNKTTYYHKLEDAASEGGTIKVERDVIDTSTRVRVVNDIILDLENNVVTMQNVPVEVFAGGKIKIIGDEKGTLKNNGDTVIINNGGEVQIGNENGRIYDFPTIEGNKKGVEGYFVMDGGKIIGTDNPPYDTTPSHSRNYVEVVKDKVGDKYVITIRIEKNPPEISATPSTTLPTKENVILTVKVTDDLSGVETVTAVVNGTNREITLDNNMEVQLEVTENQTVIITAKDYAGNSAVKEVIISNIDKNAAIITNVTVENQSSNGTVNNTLVILNNIIVDSDDVADVFFSNTNTPPVYGDDGWLDYSRNMEVPWVLDNRDGNGEKKIYAWAIDEAGNISKEPYIITVNLQTTLIGGARNKVILDVMVYDENYWKHTITNNDIKYQTENSNFTGNVTSVLVDDKFIYQGISSLKYKSTLTDISGSGTLYVTVTEGAYIDKAGNINSGSQKATGITVDTFEPTITSNGGGSFTISDEEGHIAAITVNGKMVSKVATTISVTPGSIIKAYDLAGNVSVYEY